MRVVSLNNNSNSGVLQKTLQVLKNGGLVVFPSDTVYGLLVDAANEQAVTKLIKFKNRPAGKAISVFVADFKMLSYIVKVDKQTENRLRQILPGPFTIVLRSKGRVDRQLESEKNTLGVRMPDYHLVQALVKQFGKPLTATSANLSSQSPHHSVNSFLNQVSDKKKKLIDLIIDAGQLPRNKPSTVIDLTKAKVKIIRQGEISFLNRQSFISKSPQQTKKIAKSALKKMLQATHFRLNRPLVFIIEGELGVGKTVFVKGVGEAVGVTNIISPTFVIYYEYDLAHSRRPRTTASGKRLIHVDLYNLQDEAEFAHLGLEKYLQPGNIFCFEWGEKTGKILNMLSKKGEIIYINMKYVDSVTREIKVSY